MAKLSKTLLKEIVKECLVEILAEGLTNGSSAELNENIQSVPKSRQSTASRIMKNMLPPKEKVVNESFQENARKVISSVTSDPVMADLLADTAQTTLQEQNSADSSNRFAGKATDKASQIVSESDPEELFGGAASNWAQLAFSGSPK